MEARIDFRKMAPNFHKVYEAMLAVESAINAGGLQSSLLYLVWVRASQMNGCAY